MRANGRGAMKSAPPVGNNVGKAYSRKLDESWTTKLGLIRLQLLFDYVLLCQHLSAGWNK